MRRRLPRRSNSVTWNSLRESNSLFPLQFLFHALGHHSNFHDGRFELSARAPEPFCPILRFGFVENVHTLLVL